MNKKTIFFACVLALSLITIAIAQTSKITLREVKDCKTINWETEEPEYGTCRRDYTTIVCDDEPINKSCHEETRYYDYTCQTGTRTVQHSEEVCTPKAFEITKELADTVTEKGRINFKEWGKCSYEKQDDKLIVEFFFFDFV